jgi:quercetin dioxygenase-like cupin family protein
MTDVSSRTYTALNAVHMFPGVVRRTLASGDRLTLVEIRIEAGSHVPEHTHPHEQAGHVAAGRLFARIDGQEFHLEAGDSYLIPGDALHYVEAIEATTLIEAFSPVRQDFVDAPQ